ncbi:enterochelin esterase, partial [Pantoea agglomerans]
MPADWRGSSGLFPDSPEETFTGQADMLAVRQWWSQKCPLAQSDPLN